MKELSLNILDIAQNSVKAGAANIDITIEESETELVFGITDDGCGMSPDFLKNVTSPFTTTRTTRKVGLGLPLLKMEAEMTGGGMSITSKTAEMSEEHGTTVSARFIKTSIDYIPLGNIVETLVVLIQGAREVDYSFKHTYPGGMAELSTKEMRKMLGDVPLESPEVLAWVRDYLRECYESPSNGVI